MRNPSSWRSTTEAQAAGRSRYLRDDQVKADVGKRWPGDDEEAPVNFVSGVIWSNVMLAVAPTVTGAAPS